MASTDVFARLEGDVELVKALDKIGAAVANKIVKSATGFAMTPVNKEAKRRAPRVTGALRRSIGKKTKGYRKSGIAISVVGIRTQYRDKTTIGSDGLGVIPNKYGHDIEFGRRNRIAKPFLRPALIAKKGEVRSRMIRKSWELIQKEAAKVGK